VHASGGRERAVVPCAARGCRRRASDPPREASCACRGAAGTLERRSGWVSARACRLLAGARAGGAGMPGRQWGPRATGASTGPCGSAWGCNCAGLCRVLEGFNERLWRGAAQGPADGGDGQEGEERCRRAVDAARALCHCGAQTAARHARGDHAASGEQLAFGRAPPQRARMARFHIFAHHFRTLLHTLHIVSSSRSACRLCRRAATAPPAPVCWHVCDACERSAAVVL
jgi:hypothetical protein